MIDKKWHGFVLVLHQSEVINCASFWSLSYCCGEIDENSSAPSHFLLFTRARQSGDWAWLVIWDEYFFTHILPCVQFSRMFNLFYCFVEWGLVVRVWLTVVFTLFLVRASLGCRVHQVNQVPEDHRCVSMDPLFRRSFSFAFTIIIYYGLNASINTISRDGKSPQISPKLIDIIYFSIISKYHILKKECNYSMYHDFVKILYIHLKGLLASQNNAALLVASHFKRFKRQWMFPFTGYNRSKKPDISQVRRVPIDI